MLNTKAQEHLCGIPEPTDAEVEARELMIKALKKNKRGARLSATEPAYIPVRFHVLQRNNGADGATLTELNQALARANSKYLESGIQFYMAGSTPNYIPSDTYYDFDFTEETALTASHYVSSAINLYVVGTLTYYSSSVAGYAYYPATSAVSNRIFMRRDALLDGRTLIHELGHYFNLLHTFHNNSSSNLALRELVTRAAGANCTITGDLLCDTPADPYGLGNSNTQGCTYTGTVTDVNGQLFTPSLTNIMSYYFCGNDFTAGQHGRMADGLLLRQLPANQYVLNYASANALPSNLVATYGGQGVQVTFTDNSSDESGFQIERATAPGGPYLALAGLAPNVTSYLDNAIVTNTLYYYRVRASNSIQYSAVDTANVQQFYCQPLYGSPCSPVVIADFIMSGAGINNLNTGCGVASYSNFTNITGQVVAGQSYSFTARAVPGGVGTYFPQQLSIWIDFNKDGIFETNERVFQSSSAMAPTLTGTITIPAGAQAGSTRMRVRSAYNVAANDPCSSLTFGEAEDYTLNITSSSPTIQTTTLSATNICRGDALQVAFTHTGSFGANSTFAVELAPVGSSTYVAVPTSGTASPLTATIPAGTAAGTYKVRVVANGVASPESTQQLVVNAVPGAPTLAASTLSVCPGEAAILTASQCSGLVSWSHGPTGSSVEVSPSTATTYTATCTVGGCVSGASAAITIGIKPLVQATLSGGGTFALGDSATLTVLCTTGALPWQFTLSDNTLYANLMSPSVQVKVAPPTTTTYTLLAVQDAACGLGTGGGSAQVEVLAPSAVALQLRVFLEGPYRSNTGLMITGLNQRGLLPGQTPVNIHATPTPPGQPYGGSPWSYFGPETQSTYATTVVDWVLVSLRATTSVQSTLYRTAALLHNNGWITFVGSGPALDPQQSYYVVVEHRNHLGVLSHQAVPVQNGTLTYDFTAQDTYTATTPVSMGQKQIGSIFAMLAGDGDKSLPNQNFDINVRDHNLWFGANGIFDVYFGVDFNLDAQVSASDKAVWNTNNGRFSLIGRQ
ncbi:hypothetical protein GCM10027275_27370 [Rhabdobacter roseus]